jgi:hypothetical protein
VFQAVNSAGGALRNASGSNQLQWGGGGGNNVTIDVSTNINGANAQIDISPTGNSGHVHIKPTGTPSVEIAPAYTGSINNMIIGNITPAAVSATTVSASGNITGNVFIGNGAGLTNINAANIIGGYGNANVADFLGNGFGSNTITTTGNITTGNLLTSGVVSATGNITSGNITNNGTITSIGNITAPNFIGNIAGNVVAGGANTQVQFNDNNLLNGTAGFTFDKTSNALAVTGNVSTGNVIVPNGSRYRGDFSAAPTAGRSYFQTTGTGTTAQTFISALPGPNHVDTPGTFGTATGLFSSNDPGNASIFGMYSYPTDASIRSLALGTGNVNDITFRFGGTGTLAATVTAAGLVSAVGNVQGANLVTTGLATVSGNITGGNLITAGLATVSGNITGGNLITAGVVTATGNINGANLVASANLTSTQQTVIGTANITGGTGNIVVSGKNIATDMAFNPDGGNTITAPLSRIVVGTSWLGNLTHSAVQNRLLVQDTFARGNTGTSVQLLASDPIVSLTANVTNASFRAQGIGSRVRIGGGSAGNTIQLSGGAGIIGAVAALQPNIDVGNVSPYLLGNTTISHAVLNGGFITMYQGSLLGNAYGMIPGALATSTGNALAAGNITNYTGFASNLNASPYITGNLYAFYHGNVSGSAQQTATGLATAAAARTATNYYAFRNDDPVAQVQLGSLRNYHEYQYSTATTGTVNIDKNNAQIQFIAPTANVTIGEFQNFVTNAIDGTNNDAQTDTVTLVIQQGATPYTVTMPTGNASIKYVGNATTVGTTANSVTMISITAIRSSANAALYLTTVSPEFV